MYEEAAVYENSTVQLYVQFLFILISTITDCLAIIQVVVTVFAV